MFKSVSVAGVCVLAGYTGLGSYARQSNALSKEAALVASNAESIFETASSSESLSGWKARSLESLGALASECAHDNWDGYGARALSASAAARAELLIRMLPEGLPVPEVAAEPDGSVSLEWIASRNRMLSVSVGETDRLAFAWMFGTEREHGVINSDGAQVPGRLLQKILYVMDRTNADIRVA